MTEAGSGTLLNQLFLDEGQREAQSSVRGGGAIDPRRLGCRRIVVWPIAKDSICSWPTKT
jgi:hypothetical protein